MRPAESSSSAAAPECPCTHCGAFLPASAKWCGTCGQAVVKDFFISYNHADQGWAEWIAWCLEAAGYTTLIQAWDIRPGSNFLVEMDHAFKSTLRTIAVLSPDYLASQYTTPEWADALRRDPTGAKRLLVPVRVRPCEPEGWLASVVYIDLLGLPQEEARACLLDRVKADGRPARAPTYPPSAGPAYPAPVVARWLVPHRRNPFFTGRDDTLEQVHAAFTARPGIVTQALTGLGGVGKTQTALEYIYRHQQEYQAIFWVQAETPETLSGGLLKLAALLNLPERDAKEQSVVVAAVRRWLETHDHWLLILDNVEDPQVAREALPTRGQGHVLLTTRDPATGTLAHPLLLETLSEEEGITFLLRRARLPTPPTVEAVTAQRDEARTIIKEMDALPLALDQAGAYVEETQCGLKDYLALYQTHRKALLARRGRTSADHTDSVATTFALGFEKVARANKAAADLLRICAFLSPEAIPEELFSAGAEALPSALRRVASDPLRWNDTIEVLRRYALLERQPGSQTLSIHGLVQAVLKDALPTASQRRWAERVVRLVNAAFPDVEFPPWKQCQRCLPHAQVCASWIDQWNQTFPEAARLLHQMGFYLVERAQYTQAEAPLKRAIAIWEGQDSPDQLTIAKGLNSLAILYQCQGKYPQALPLFQRALELSEQQVGPSHPTVATVLNNLAALYKDQGQYPLASHAYERSLAISEQQLGPNHLEVAICLSNLADLHQALGNNEEASRLLQRAWPIVIQLGPSHLEFTLMLTKMARLYQALGQVAQALSLLQLARSLSEQQVGPDHPDTATILSELSTIYYRQGQYDQALNLSQQVREIWEKRLGADHPYVATCLNNMAAICQAQGEYTEAVSLLQRALIIRRQQLGAGHPDVAQCFHNLAVIHDIQGQGEQALILYQHAQAIWEEGLGPDHPEVESNLQHQLALLRKMQQEDRAASLEARIQAIRAKRRQSS